MASAVQEAYGDATSYMDLEKMVDYILEPGTDRQDSMRYFGNVATSQAGVSRLRVAAVARIAPVRRVGVSAAVTAARAGGGSSAPIPLRRKRTV